MKRVQMFLAGAFIAVGSLYAQTPASEWKAGVAKLKETIQANPAQAAEEAEQMIKGKNKKEYRAVAGYRRGLSGSWQNTGSSAICGSCQKSKRQIG